MWKQVRLGVALMVALFSMPLFAEAVEQPSIGLLEYLGSWEDEQGNWIDPQELTDTALAWLEREDEMGDKQNDD